MNSAPLRFSLVFQRSIGFFHVLTQDVDAHKLLLLTNCVSSDSESVILVVIYGVLLFAHLLQESFVLLGQKLQKRKTDHWVLKKYFFMMNIEPIQDLSNIVCAELFSDHSHNEAVSIVVFVEGVILDVLKHLPGLKLLGLL